MERALVCPKQHKGGGIMYRMMVRKISILLCCLPLVYSSGALALDISDIDGDWNNPIGGAGIEFFDDDLMAPGMGLNEEIRWGFGSGGKTLDRFSKSGFRFDGNAPQNGITPGDIINLGEFTHFNAITFGGSVSAADLTIQMTVTGATPDPANLAFNFTLDTTGNFGTTTGSPFFPDPWCPATGEQVPTEGCPDVVGFPNVLADTVFEMDGKEFTLELLGFSTDGGNTILTDIFTAEGDTDVAQLYGKFTSVSIPSTLLLFGAGFAGFVAWRRQKEKL